MAHKRKDNLTVAREWWKHLRPFNKRLVSKAERRAAKEDIEGTLNDTEEQVKGLGLHKDPNI